MNDIDTQSVSLSFALDVEEGWPPVAIESLPFVRVSPNEYRLLSVPLFVKNLSVGDVLAPTARTGDDVLVDWDHVVRSERTTIWLLRLRATSAIDRALQAARNLGCNTSGVDQFGVYAIDVPAEIELSQVDEVLNNLDPDDVAVAFPSLRHPEG